MNKFVVACLGLSGSLLYAQEPLMPQTAVLPDGTEITLSAQSASNTRTAAQGLRRRIVIFVDNTTEPELDAAAVRLQNQLAAQAAGEDFEIVDYRDIIAAVAPLPETPQRADGAAQLEQEAKVVERILKRLGQADRPTAGGPGTTQDQNLLANISRQRLAQNMGADYFLLITLDRYDKSVTTYRPPEIPEGIVSDTYRLSASYKVVDCWSGSAIAGDTLSAVKRVRQTKTVTRQYGSFADGLEEKLVMQMRNNLSNNAAKWRAASKALNGIQVQFIAQACDTDNKPYYLPLYDGKRLILNEGTAVQIGATVEIDGIAQGSTPCAIFLSQGLHKVRLRKPGYDDETFTIKPNDGLVIAATLRMTEGEANRLRSSTEFMARMTRQKELTQAEVERIEGEAQMLRQSGYKIDSKKAPDNYLFTPLFERVR